MIDLRSGEFRSGRHEDMMPALTIAPDTQLGLAMLIAEDDDGHYEPVASAGTISEAQEMAASDFRNRMHRVEEGQDVLCPVVYKLWARGADGCYQLVHEIKGLLAQIGLEVFSTPSDECDDRKYKRQKEKQANVHFHNRY